MHAYLIVHSANPYNFLGIVDLGRKRDVTEPVDRLYKLLGLAADNIRDSIQINESKEHGEKFWKAHIEFGKLWAKLDYRYFHFIKLPFSKDRPPE